VGSKDSKRRRRAKARRKQNVKAASAASASPPDKQISWPIQLQDIPDEVWKTGEEPKSLIRVMRSKNYMVQEYEEGKNVIRLFIQRVKFNKLEDKLADAIPWDVIQRLKAEAGYKENSAVEVYPPDAYDIDKKQESGLNDGRHLFIYLTGAPFFMFGYTDWKGDQPVIIVPGAK